MEQITWLTVCIVFIICLTVFLTVLIWKRFDWYKLKTELKHKEILEDKRLDAKKSLKQSEELKKEITETLKKEIVEELKKEVSELVNKQLTKTLEEKIKTLEDKLDLIKFKSEKN